MKTLRSRTASPPRRRGYTRAAMTGMVALAGLGAAMALRPSRADEPPVSAPVYLQAGAPVERRVEDLLARLTPDEKLSLLTGTGFATQAIPRLGVPAMEMVDAPQGVRGGSRGTFGPATLFPAGIAMAATWDPDRIQQVGAALGAEARGKGTGADVLLGPCVNIHRSPQGGRNTESYSEDPYLAARTATAYVRGVQSQGTAACVKHFACNNEEIDRGSVNVVVGERALHEIYLPAFEAAVRQGHAWTVMAAYNQVNGFHCTANRLLLTDILKKQWGFNGLVMSDWGAIHEAAGVVRAGNDLEMPGGEFLTLANLQTARQKGAITPVEVDDSVRRILRTLVRTGLLDGSKARDPKAVDSPEHRRLAYAVASEAIVLLKNDSLPAFRTRSYPTGTQTTLLPLQKTVRSIAVIGPNAAVQRLGNRGSAAAYPSHADSPLDALTRRAGPLGIRIRYAQGTPLGVGGDTLPACPAAALIAPDGSHGLRGEYFTGVTPGEGQPALTRTDAQVDFVWHGAPAKGIPATYFSARWTGRLLPPRTGRYTLGLSSDDGSRLYLGDKLILDNWGDHAAQRKTVVVTLTAGQSYPIRIEYYQGRGDALVHFGWIPPAAPGGPAEFADAVAAAANSEVAVVFAGASEDFEGEGLDRQDLHLSGRQDALIAAVAKANPRTVVVLNTGTPVLMGDWAGRVPAILQGWYSGEEGANALAAILFGDASPSGKLPDTYAARREDYPNYGNFPGKDGTVRYVEGIYVGYRHFDKKGIAPRFPFGHGLSYTTFAYGGLKVAPAVGKASLPAATVRVSLRNAGARAGAEVAQLYIRPLAPRVDRPVRELKGFQRVFLKPGASVTLSFPLDARSFARWDATTHAWKADPGRYAVEVGSSSRDLRAMGTITLL